ncbi:DUF3826 domain-containing protein [Sphingobacterium lactis]|uniref:DUF3826 domain-containing protein n=1 Tax=Sphingobacterium lactis TaxID=797291 RepID=A0A1H6CIL6_9SPHI|nr:DUF3826 domain-containing protein [Sphingobacterium lactis]SEG72748.1 Protein of unknown function [Sphingobacterium lactis]
MKNYILMMMFIAFGTLNSSAQTEREAYLEVITKRSDKIIATLNIQDPKVYSEVLADLVNQYDLLNTNHENHSAKLAAIKNNSSFSKDKQEEEIKLLSDRNEKAIAKLHDLFIKKLDKNLNDEQIAKLKDGMTYSILPRTYTAYVEMIPSLTSVQKDTIMNMLVEAREKAIDAPSADAKHAVFGKYKGRINNYLSKEGFDLKIEGEKWKERIAAQEKAKKN